MKNVTEIPTRQNTITRDEQIVVQPIYAKVPQLAKLCGFSKSTVYRILDRWEDEPNGIDDMFVSISATLKVVEIEKFKTYLRIINKKWM
ncbi:helix-turn-helix domain-containing protein [Mammaliicoccus sp. G-M28]|uniref:helix-turn-helix domain-containing protein n=1 Tax=Mammaliicoccus sp. G-M28 TaxID=2898688 RepID=UPI001EFA734C|nr:helix-turn-helix domain-containing protein [Mammaliicoccus sp. G-M28]